MVSVNDWIVVLSCFLICHRCLAIPEYEIRVSVLKFNVSSTCLRRNCLEDRLNIIFREGNRFESIHAIGLRRAEKSIDLSNFSIEIASSDFVAHFFPVSLGLPKSNYDISLKITGFDPIFKFSRVCDSTAESFEYIVDDRGRKNEEFSVLKNVTARCFDVELSIQGRRVDMQEIQNSHFSKNSIAPKKNDAGSNAVFFVCLLLIASLICLTVYLMHIAIRLVLKHGKEKSDGNYNHIRKCNIMITAE